MSRHFNGTTDGLLNSSATALDGLSAVSLFAWLAPEQATTQTIIRFSDPGSAPFLSWGFASASGKIEGQYAIAGTLFKLDSTTSHPTDGTWIAVGLTVTSGAQHLYYSGSSQASGSASGTVQNLTDNRFSVGYSPAFGERFKGSAAHVAVWSTALTSTQMSDLAGGANPLAVAAANLIGYWPLAGDDSPEPDEAGTTDLTVTGTTQADDPPGVDSPPGGTTQTVNPSAIASGSTVRTPALSATFTLSPSAVASGASVLAPTVTPGAVTVSPATIASTAQLFTPSTGGTSTVSPDLLDNAETLHAPTITSRVTVAAGHIASGASVHAATATVGAVTLSPALLENGPSVFRPSITGGTQTETTRAVWVPTLPTIGNAQAGQGVQP